MDLLEGCILRLSEQKLQTVVWCPVQVSTWVLHPCKRYVDSPLPLIWTWLVPCIVECSNSWPVFSSVQLWIDSHHYYLLRQACCLCFWSSVLRSFGLSVHKWSCKNTVWSLLQKLWELGCSRPRRRWCDTFVMNYNILVCISSNPTLWSVSQGLLDVWVLNS